MFVLLILLVALVVSALAYMLTSCFVNQRTQENHLTNIAVLSIVINVVSIISIVVHGFCLCLVTVFLIYMTWFA